MDTPTAATAKHDATLAFVNCLFEPTDTIALRPVEVWTDGGKRKARVIHKEIAYPQNTGFIFRRAFERFLEVGQREHANLFFGVCPRVGPKGFDKAWQIRTVRTLWADVDDCLPHVALERCNATGLPRPTIIVASGNGTHLYWKLAEPHLIDDAGPAPEIFIDWLEKPDGKKRKREWYAHPETKAKLYLDGPQDVPPLSPKAVRIQDILSGIAAAIGGDHTQDVSRLLRLPGTLNRKDERNGRAPTACQLVEIDADRTHPLADFERFIAAAPSKHDREAIAAIKLPVARKRIGETRQDKLNALLNLCASAPAGERSEHDFNFCCRALRYGIDVSTAWGMAAAVGKFAECGEAYFQRTWSAAQGEVKEQIYRHLEARSAAKSNGRINGHAVNENGKVNRKDDTPPSDGDLIEFCNFTAGLNADGNPDRLPKSMSDCLNALNELTGGWPRRVDNMLFVEEPAGNVAWLSKTAALFGWASHKLGNVHWGKGEGFIDREELYCEVQRTATAYRSIETLPHFPKVAGHYYLGRDPEPGDGESLRKLLERFTPSTAVDGDLLKAALCTLFWGGAAGTRPAFIVTSDSGRGAGKSKLVEMFGLVVGGMSDFSTKDDVAAIKTRLLTTDAMTRRIALLDNIKSLRFSWPELEALITASVISGHRMYVGEASRPNLLTWFLTLNGASLSTDIAQRSVIIKIDAPIRTGEWEDETRKFVVDNRDKIVADVAAFFAEPPHALEKFSRWATWEREILGRLPEPSEAQALIKERQNVADTEREEHESLEDFFADRLRALRYDPLCDKVFIPSEICCRWFNACQNSHQRTGQVTTTIKNAIEQKILTRFENFGRSYGRGFCWVGEQWTSNRNTWTDIRDRVAEKISGGQKTYEDFLF